MIKTAAFALTAALMSVAPAAFAEPAKTAPEPATEQTEAVQAPAARPVRYCVIETLTGSRIPVKQCQTRADWLAQGFDPLAK